MASNARQISQGIFQANNTVTDKRRPTNELNTPLIALLK
jgi:hypothetical protein